MTFLDILIVFIVLMGMWRGFGAGCIKTASSLVAWLVAFVIASRIASDFAPMLAVVIDSPVLQVAAMFLLLALAAMTVMQLFIAILIGLVKTLRLGLLDSMLGGVLGAALGILKVLILLSIAAPLLVYLPNWQESILTQNLLPLAPTATELLKQVLGDAWQQIENPYQSS